MLKRIFFGLGVVALLFLTTACGPPPDGEGINLVVILGNRANTYAFSQSDLDTIRSYVERSFSAIDGNSRYNLNANLWFVLSDGSPSVIPLRSGLTSISHNNPNRVNRTWDRNINSIIRDIQNSPSFRAQAPEADLIGALRLATSLLEGVNGDGAENHILIVDSGITTAGVLNMRYPVFDMRDEEEPIYDIVTPLVNRRVLPNMGDLNVEVTFIGIGGSAAYPQLTPNDGYFRDWLIDLWKEVLVESGVSSSQITLRWGVSGQERTSTFPSVSTVDFREGYPAGLVGPPGPLCGSGWGCSGGGVVIPYYNLQFVGDRAIFLYPEVAQSTLEAFHEPLEHFFRENPNANVYIVGSEARLRLERPNPSEPQLSRDRAAAVIGVLVSFGLPAERLIAVGGGTTILSWRNVAESYYPDGRLIIASGNPNRVVAIIPYATPRYNELRDSGLLN